MPIPNITDQNVIDALKYIDENGIPKQNESVKYQLVNAEGKKYPPKYVVAIADHLANGTDIRTNTYTSDEANNYLKDLGYAIEEKQVKYELTITEDSAISTDDRFSIDNLLLGDNYKPLDVYFQKGDGEPIRRKYSKGERRNSNQTLPRLACQIFEKQISAISAADKAEFPICQYSPDKKVIRGIFSSVEEFKKYKNSKEVMTYSREGGPQFAFYCWNIFSTLIFIQECLKRFGDEGDRFVLIYREKDENETKKEDQEIAINEELVEQVKGYRNPYSKMLVQSKNIIFRGAPGTGKSYLAKEIAADIISDGFEDHYDALSDEQKKQVEFVQFHPSYDYSDFVEGLRPKMNEDGSMGFELQDGIFKNFVDRARRNYEDSQKDQDAIDLEEYAKEAMADFFENIEFGKTKFKTMKGNEFNISDVDDKHIYITIPGNASSSKLSLNMDELRKMLESGESFEKITDITRFFGKQFATQGYSYDFALYKEIKAKQRKTKVPSREAEKLKKYIFIIDEINRGEISKILGELFFAIDPGYRGKEGSVSTQYSNMHADPNEKFYIPDNVYIIGTMNDIDRSVDSFDFAMRRRFRFIEIKADEQLEMLDLLDDEELKSEAINRMAALNKVIAGVEDLNENYQIGAAYFLKLRAMNFDELWTDCLQPLLRDYIQGMYDEKGIMDRFAKAYGYSTPIEEGTDEAAQSQG